MINATVSTSVISEFADLPYRKRLVVENLPGYFVTTTTSDEIWDKYVLLLLLFHPNIQERRIST